MRRVTTAAPTISQRVHSLNRPNMVSVGTIVWLSSELMFFAGLFAMFFTVKAQNSSGQWPPPLHGEEFHLNVTYAIPFTVILVLSSLTCQFGVFAAEVARDCEASGDQAVAFGAAPEFYFGCVEGLARHVMRAARGWDDSRARA